MARRRNEKLSDLVRRKSNQPPEGKTDKAISISAQLEKIIDEIERAREELGEMFKEPDQNTEQDQNPVTEIEDNKEENRSPDDRPRQSENRSKKKKILIRILTFLIAGCIMMLLILLAETAKNPSVSPEKQEPGSLDIISSKPEQAFKEKWLACKEINDDFIGKIVFDSGIIDLPIVQAEDVYRKDGTLYEFYSQDGTRISDPTGYSGNDVYIWSDWKDHSYDKAGNDQAVFMDYRNSLSDQNLILYGHHIARDYDPEGNREFTPLDLLLDKDNYEANRNLRLILENEIREYEVAAVFTINAFDKDEVEIIRTDLNRDLSGNEDPDFCERYFRMIEKNISYDTGVKIGSDDRILTLVTCIQHQPELRQIVICRETGRTTYE